MNLPPVPEPSPEEARTTEIKAAEERKLTAKHRQAKQIRDASQGLALTTVGLTLGIAVALGVGLGIWLDRVFHTGGILVIVGSLAGIIAGFKQLIDAVIKAGKQQDRK